MPAPQIIRFTDSTLGNTDSTLGNTDSTLGESFFSKRLKPAPLLGKTNFKKSGNNANRLLIDN